MDDASRRTLVFNVANNRTATDVAKHAAKLFDWMTARGNQGEQALIAANNSVAPQSSIEEILKTATDNYAFMTGGDGSPVAEKQEPVEE